MYSISRRGLVVSAAAAGAAFGLKGPLEFVSPASAQKAGSGSGSESMAGLMEKGFAKFKVGDWNVTQMFDGVWEKAHDPAFIKNASVDDTKAALKAAGMTDAHVPIPFTVTVVEKGGKTIMFDSGTGGQAGGPKAGLIAKKNLAAAGIDAAKISTILVTHFHGDHIFGLMAKDTNTQVFPNAEIIVPEAELQVLGRPRPDREAAGGAPGPRQAHPGDVADLEERQAGRRRQGSGAWHRVGQHQRPHARPYGLCRRLRRVAS